jgi:hypothetical protein
VGAWVLGLRKKFRYKSKKKNEAAYLCPYAKTTNLSVRPPRHGKEYLWKKTSISLGVAVFRHRLAH